MSTLGGIWHYDKKPITPETIAAFEQCLAQQGPDGGGQYRDAGFAMLYRAFHLTEEDALETQLKRSPHGGVFTWDGRLDNREEILAALGRSVLELPTDAAIARAALQTWGAKAFARLIGDWALASWNPRERRLQLARDYMGVRKLYYLATDHSFFWSTDLAALVLHSGERFSLSDEYFAGYFAAQPEPHLTPYTEIQLVPPGGYLEVTPGKVRVHRYWSFNALPDIRYRFDAEYEEQFRNLFRQSVKRRLRTSYPILADLSGGLDSSSIVCMAHDILMQGEASADLHTLSYYSTDEPGGDERPYFTAVEELIGKQGTHIHIERDDSPLRPLREPYFAALPGYFDSSFDAERRFDAQLGGLPYRTRFAGIGGDELLGGAQNPVPELAWLLWNLRLPSLWRQLLAWSLQRKTTLWSLAGHSLLSLAPLLIRERLNAASNDLPWIRTEFAKRQHIARRRIRSVTDKPAWMPGPPSADSGYLALATTISNALPALTRAGHTALPYYDRDLVSFLFAIPGEQVLRPQQRRSLMRRALKGIVPDMVLSRKTKWLGRREPALALLDREQLLLKMLNHTAIGERYIDAAEVEGDFGKLRQGKEVALLLLDRVLGACFWSQEIAGRQLWDGIDNSGERADARSEISGARHWKQYAS
jgi:asparagine synthase (glutamine-hydrolysing)